METKLMEHDKEGVFTPRDLMDTLNLYIRAPLELVLDRLVEVDEKRVMNASDTLSATLRLWDKIENEACKLTIGQRAGKD